MTYRSTQLEQAVADLLSYHGFRYHRVENYRCFKCGQVQNSKAASWPDFFVYAPVFLAIECKTGSGKMTDGQSEVQMYLERQGVEYMILTDTVDYLLQWFEIYLRQHI